MDTFQSRAGAYLREGPGGVNLEKIAVYAGLAVIAYMAWKAYRIGDKVADTVAAGYDKARTSTGNVIEWFFPLDVGEMTYYTIRFPDGKNHAIGARGIAPDGSFTVPTVDRKTGKVTQDVVNSIPALRGKYRIQVDKSIVAGGNKFAVRV